MILNELGRAATRDFAIWVPWMEAADGTEGGHAAIRSLRMNGEVVVVALSADDERPLRCDRVLNHRDGDWVLDPAAS